MAGPDYIHVYPRRDLADHVVDGRPCWCAPKSSREIGGFVIIHNALDDSLNDEAIPRPQS